MDCSRSCRRNAFSAVELVVVFALLLLGMALLVPVIARLREATEKLQATNNLKHLALAMHSYHDSHRSLPPTVGENAGQDGTAHFHILPYVEQAPVWQNANGAVWKNGTYGTVINVFLDPRDQSLPGNLFKNWLATTNYPVNWMVFKEGKTKLTTITDGTSNTFMFVQRLQMCGGQPTAWGYPSIHTWTPMFAYYSEERFQSAPRAEACNPELTQSIGREILVALCDSTVRPVPPDIRPTVWYHLTDPNDGQAIPADTFP